MILLGRKLWINSNILKIKKVTHRTLNFKQAKVIKQSKYLTGQYNFDIQLQKRKFFDLQQAFNTDEKGLFYKQLRKRTYISKEQKIVPGIF